MREDENNEWKEKLRLFMEGLECQNIENFMELANEKAYFELGKNMAQITKDLIKYIP